MDKSSTSRTANAERDRQTEALAEQAKHAAARAAGQAKEQVSSELESRKGKAVETIETVAESIRGTGEKLKGGPLADVAERAADRIEQMAEQFKGKTAGDMVRVVERFARREPALFLAAALAVGLIGGRFLKSSGPPARGSKPLGAAQAREGNYGYEYEPEAYSASYDEEIAAEYLADDDVRAEEEARGA